MGGRRRGWGRGTGGQCYLLDGHERYRQTSVWEVETIPKEEDEGVFEGGSCVGEVPSKMKKEKGLKEVVKILYTLREKIFIGGGNPGYSGTLIGEKR